MDENAEHILKAELQLWLNVRSPPQDTANTHIVGIKPVRADGGGSRPVLRFMEVGRYDRYVKFEVDELLRDIVAQGEHLYCHVMEFGVTQHIIYEEISFFLIRNKCRGLRSLS